MEVIAGMTIDCDFQILVLHSRIFFAAVGSGVCFKALVQLEDHLLQTMAGVMRLAVQILCCLLGVFGLKECIRSQIFNVLFLCLVLALYSKLKIPNFEFERGC
jgi:hypothetical protein